MESLQVSSNLLTDPRLSERKKLTKAPGSTTAPQSRRSLRKVNSHQDIQATVYNRDGTTKTSIPPTLGQVRAIPIDSRLTSQYSIPRGQKTGKAEPFTKHPQFLTPSVETPSKSEKKHVDVNIKPVSYAQKLKQNSTRKKNYHPTAHNNNQSKIKECLCNHQNIIRIQAALKSKCWTPPEPPASIKPLSKGFTGQIDAYHKHLEKQLAEIKDPIERCLRVTTSNYVYRALIQ